jgi:hypothetical protein
VWILYQSVSWNTTEKRVTPQFAARFAGLHAPAREQTRKKCHNMAYFQIYLLAGNYWRV